MIDKACTSEPSHWMGEVAGCLYTNSHQLLDEDCSWVFLFPSTPGLGLLCGKAECFFQVLENLQTLSGKEVQVQAVRRGTHTFIMMPEEHRWASAVSAPQSSPLSLQKGTCDKCGSMLVQKHRDGGLRQRSCRLPLRGVSVSVLAVPVVLEKNLEKQLWRLLHIQRI